MITRNEVFNYIATKVNAYCTGYYEVVPKSFPCVYVRFSWNPMRRYIALDFTDEQVRAYAYIEVYGQNIDATVLEVESVMKEMNFVEELAEQVPNYDPSVERVSMRFCRVITGQDSLPALPTPTEPSAEPNESDPTENTTPTESEENNG